MHAYPPTAPPEVQLQYIEPPRVFAPNEVMLGTTRIIHPGTATTVYPGTAAMNNGPSVTPNPRVISRQLGPQPTAYVCPSCNQHVVTRVDLKSSMNTHFFALLLCILCCWPCACIPYCVDKCKNADHYCSNCNAYLGIYNS